MNKIKIRLVGKDEDVPYELLLDADPSRKQIDSYYHPERCIVGYDGSKIVGALVWVKNTDSILEIMNIAVFPSHQKTGLGKKLMAYFFNLAKHKKYYSIQIGTADVSEHPIAWYERIGFRRISIRKDYFINNYNSPVIDNGNICRDMIVLEKKIDSE